VNLGRQLLDHWLVAPAINITQGIFHIVHGGRDHVEKARPSGLFLRCPALEQATRFLQSFCSAQNAGASAWAACCNLFQHCKDICPLKLVGSGCAKQHAQQ